MDKGRYKDGKEFRVLLSDEIRTVWGANQSYGFGMQNVFNGGAL